MVKGLRDLNVFVAEEMNRKFTVKEMEEHARLTMESMQRDFKNYPKLYKDYEKGIEFYRGILRAIELLRKHGLLKE